MTSLVINTKNELLETALALSSPLPWKAIIERIRRKREKKLINQYNKTRSKKYEI